MTKVLFCGAGYGAGNIGDDAILAGLLIASRMYLQKDTQYGIIAFGPNFPKDGIGIDKVFKSHNEVDKAFDWATHVILGGASLLAAGSVAYCSMLIKQAQERDKPVCMLGVGSSTELVGSLLWLFQQHYSSLDMITLRSEADKEAAISMGLRAENLYVCADGAFAIDYESITEIPKNILGVNLVHEELPNRHTYVKTVTSLLKGLEKDLTFSFLCEETRKDMQYDFFLLHELHQQFGGTLSCEYLDYQNFLKKMSACRLILTMRMHMMVFCALLGIPCVPIIREVKMKMMADELGLTKTLALDETVLNAQSLMVGILKDLNIAKADKTKVEALRKRAFNNGFMLQKWMSHTLKT
ncbi:polysaccharide pyruvyl transferase family protein [Candidatus Babeliales bacterium]|nr:polysaccharide pyruvyl transferase family protein [Candidatus Babeliales bacterium]